MFKQVKYPESLRHGDTIAITAPSAGLDAKHYPRLELVKKHIVHQGFEIIEGKCLRHNEKSRSSSKDDRAQEFTNFWMNNDIKAIMPPWGGEVLIEILPLLDFEKLKQAKPKWISGYSDLSTLFFPLTLKTGIATVHSCNLMDLSPTQHDPLTSGLMNVFKLKRGDSFTQQSSEKYQIKFNDFTKQVESPFNLTETTQWKVLKTARSFDVMMRGRLIGGCLDTIARLVGTPFGDLNKFKNDFSADGTIFYFEVCDMDNSELVRTLWNLRLAGWFDDLSGLMIGRSSGPAPNSAYGITYLEAISSVLGDLPVPILYDVDIGHRPPQLNIINGSIGEIHFKDGKGKLVQSLL